MEPHAVDLVSQKVSDEMDVIKKTLGGTVGTITPDSLRTWDINTFIGSLVDTKAPITGHILRTAAETDHAKQKNKIKSLYTKQYIDLLKACNVIITQLAKEHSQLTIYFAAPFTFFLWTNGASRQTIEALHKCGLCISFSSLTKLINNLAAQVLDQAARFAHGPHVMCYDNINISTSIFVEQRASAPAKVQSGTFAILYEVRNGDPAHMHLSPILARAQQASDLLFSRDVLPSRDQMKSYHSQLRVHIIDILLDCCKHFENYEKPPALLHPERRKMPTGYQTKQYPLHTSTINESSVSSNIAVINDVYINQLKMTHEQLVDLAIPSINDQAMNARIRVIQLGFGLFHLCMNLIWALLHVHRGLIHQVGSLSYFFALLDRTRLGCEHPDYHTLLATLLQILRGIILNAWKAECGHTSLGAFASSNPSPDELVRIADQIILNHTTTTALDTDNAHRNFRLFTRDLLYVLELVHATSEGDFGRIEDVLGNLAMIFHGAGSNNYCSEILHFLYNIKKVWTPEFA
ncbi:hypothetical protein L210DRAFT_3608609 [Boletus edulis BED1]|uniref:DUF6589 domain-containing protein n=1 Tax=Boletus edulis BED1 TaxID=1328754 RepID=A0AAD4C9X7_BOLED|nr:hypothetical protein L210DRAFT_3608609 [Boletus edulis BED1]